MSGGYFDYQQYQIDELVYKLENYIYGKELDNEDVNDIKNSYFYNDEEKEYAIKYKRTLPNKYNYSVETIEELKNGVEILKKASIYAQRIDWLLTGDDDEDDFHERLKEELNNIKNGN